MWAATRWVLAVPPRTRRATTTSPATLTRAPAAAAASPSPSPHRHHDNTVSLPATKFGRSALHRGNSDRARRHRRLADAIVAAQAFRGWCAAAHAPRRVSGPPAGVAATLADLESARHARTLAHPSADAQQQLPPTQHSSSTMVPLPERRLLERYAALLHDVHAAAARVATADYHRVFAAAVQDVLAPSADKSNSNSDSNSSVFAVPRSAVWQDVATAHSPSSDAGGDSADATARAERRLREWAAASHAELLLWHTRGRASAVAGTAAPAPDEHRSDGGEEVEEMSLAAMLLRGQWQAALTTLVAAAADSTSSRTGGAAAAPTPADVFAAAALRRRQRVPCHTAASAAAVPMPRHLGRAPVTPAELRLLRRPPSPGLRVRPEAGGGGASMSSPSPQQWRHAEAPTGHDAGVSLSSVVRLRRRLWVLQHLPRHLSPSLVRFHEPRRGSTPHAYMLRSRGLEGLPWYVLCVLGQALATAATADAAAVTAVLADARESVSTALLLSAPADYAALHDYAHGLFVTLGHGMVARAVAAPLQQQQQQQQWSRHSRDADERAARMEAVLAHTAVALLQPPSPAAYAAAGLGDAVDAAVTAASTHPATGDPDVAGLCAVSPPILAGLCAAVQDWRNYHLSLYCETLSQIADGGGVALRVLLDVLHSSAVVVLGPESAAAVVTALLLQWLAQPPPPGAALPVLYAAVPHDKAHAVPSLFKGVYHPSFFRRVVGDDVACPSSPSLTLPPAAWERNAAARLVGRTLRRLDRYPTPTTDAFFARYVRGDRSDNDGDGDGGASVAPPLAVDVIAVDLRVALAYMRDRHCTRTDPGDVRAAATTEAIVHLAAPPLLPDGLHAVFKPAGVTCTLHTHYASLVYPFFSRVLPWRGDSAASDTAAACVPVLRQQGLVNRIDVGTSGIVLVARTATALHCATDAAVREHHVRKIYRALVQRWPPFFSSAGDAAAVGDDLAGGIPFLSPMPSATVSAPVYAAGATATAVRRRAPHAPATASTHAHQRYSTLHAALHDQRHAVTRYRVLEYFAIAGVAYVEVELHSGRRHQVRQHFAQLGFPLVGDTRYHAGAAAAAAAGRPGATWGLQRAALHAHAVDILCTPPADEEAPGRVVVQVALPSDMRRALEALRSGESAAAAAASRSRRDR
ncbi:RNA pseudouridylate synthase-like protein [Novymonas esmeraldas]|uniref:RNA pseudouridylate synthase-like protein n=1 Tax=Novymonas esmeraldas TaxID=1808958 RepID=A0AAW0EW20_9TRYP